MINTRKEVRRSNHKMEKSDSLLTNYANKHLSAINTNITKSLHEVSHKKMVEVDEENNYYYVNKLVKFDNGTFIKGKNLGTHTEFRSNKFLLCILLSILTLVILYLPFPESSIIILCDSDNHQQGKVSNNKGNLQQKQQYINREDVYFQISEPESLRYTFKARSSRIGVPFTKTLVNYALVIAEPRNSCSSIINKLEIKDNIALVERGGCSFLEKCIEIERSGSIGMIVYDYEKHNDEQYIEMIDDSTSRNCSIPAVSLLGKDGHMIVQSLLALRLNRAVITIPVATLALNKDSNPPWLNW